MRMRLRDNSSQCHVCSLFFFRSFLRREQKIVSICVCVWTSAHSSNSGHLKHWLFCVHCPSHTSSWCNSGCWLLLNYVWYQASFKWNIDVLLQRMETESERERVDLSACHLLIYRPQVSEAVEELRETTPPAGQQPQGQADRQAEDDTERGGWKKTKPPLICIFFVSFLTLIIYQ